MTKGVRLVLIAFLTITVGILLFSFPAVPQDPGYHNFADHRAMLGIPNFLNVISNLPFFVISVFGLFVLRQQQTKDKQRSFVGKTELWTYTVFFSGLALTSFGSIGYHLRPNNVSLFWDRLPMAIVFMSFFSAIIVEHINVKAGLISLLPLIILGTASVIYWELTEIKGIGDLRPYIMVQYYPMLAIPVILFLFPPRYTGSKNLIGVFAFYGLAKIFEFLDTKIFSFGHIVSGHSLKHLASAAAAFWIIRMLRQRSPISTE